MKSALFVLAGALILAIGTPAHAHHSLAGTYLMDKTETIEGTIVQFVLRNPHSYLDLEIKDTEGKITRWGVEWGGMSQLGQTGITRDTLKTGDKVTISGPPSRDASERKVLLKIIRRPSDGWVWGERPEEVIKGYSWFSPSASVPAVSPR
jgi:uncharacterized protein DUF6152